MIGYYETCLLVVIAEHHLIEHDDAIRADDTPLYLVILSYKAHNDLQKSKIPPSITTYN
jgi:hypothetical protein